jgi:hypothetical protein
VTSKTSAALASDSPVGTFSPPSPHRQCREETREILLGSPSHYANTLRDLESRLSVEASAEKREIKPERIVYLRETIRMTLDGEIADNNDNRRAKNQAGVCATSG